MWAKWQSTYFTGDLGFPTWYPRTTVFPVNQKMMCNIASTIISDKLKCVQKMSYPYPF